MKVEELIKHLYAIDPKLEVLMENPDGRSYDEIASIGYLHDRKNSNLTYVCFFHGWGKLEQNRNKIDARDIAVWGEE